MDVSGGVNRFRHKRAELQQMAVELEAKVVEAWAAQRLRGLVAERAPNVWLRVAFAQATVCISDEHEATRIDARAPAPALAFELRALADEDIVVIVSNARGINLPGPPTALATACVEALLGRHARRSGVEFTLPSPATALLKALLPEAGARAASARGIRWKMAPNEGDKWSLRAERDAAPGEPTEGARRAQEVARILHRADDMLVAGDPHRARASYLEALERAPRHPEIVQRIADIDARVAGREEAILGLMAECDATPGARSLFAATRSDLLARVGQTRAALLSFEEAVAAEPVPLLSARLCELASGYADDPEEREAWLGRALATSPRAGAARWARARARLQLGRTSEALGDVQHLDASAQRDGDRHDIWVLAGKAWQAAGLHAQAASLFERALLHVPDEPEALAGLGAALVETGAVGRGTSLLTRAVDLAEAGGRPTGAILLALARALAEHLGDLSAAVARVSAIPREAPEAPFARGLEGRWRARLGDLAGASLAFASLRDLASSRVAPAPEMAGIVELLHEAATLEKMQHHDQPVAGAQLAASRMLQPFDADAEASEIAPEDDDFQASRPAGLGSWKVGHEPDGPSESPELVSRVEDLTRRFQADPGNQDIATELAGLLESLGRSHELLALLSARLDDAPPEERTALVPRVRATLERLAASAEAGGRSGEASLYRSAIDALTG